MFNFIIGLVIGVGVARLLTPKRSDGGQGWVVW